MKVSKPIKITLILLIGSFLVAVRVFENNWFYDPFIAHFKQADYLKSVPEFETFRLIFNLLFRYVLNSFASVLILILIFDIRITRFLIVLYVSFGLLLIPAYLIIIQHYLPEAYNLFFYLRRFLIQPVLLIVLIPGFYYGRSSFR